MKSRVEACYPHIAQHGLLSRPSILPFACVMALASKHGLANKRDGAGMTWGRARGSHQRLHRTHRDLLGHHSPPHLSSTCRLRDYHREVATEISADAGPASAQHGPGSAEVGLRPEEVMGPLFRNADSATKRRASAKRHAMRGGGAFDLGAIDGT